MKVLVLGCGPAGLMAAHAAEMTGHQVLIASKKRKSELFGCQYLHQPIPGVSDPAGAVLVRYLLEGSVTDYREKVYGQGSVASVSPEDYEGDHLAWDIRSAYDGLWSKYSQFVLDVDLSDPVALQGLQTEPELIISTVPAPLLCLKPEQHLFHKQDVWALGDAPERGQFVPYNCQNNSVVCSGERDVSWYRMSRVFGYTTVEWSIDCKPPLNVSAVKKPLSTNCDCRPEIVRLGRYGKWKKGVLSHEAYYETHELLKSDWTLF